MIVELAAELKKVCGMVNLKLNLDSQAGSDEEDDDVDRYESFSERRGRGAVMAALAPRLAFMRTGSALVVKARC